MPLHPGQLLGPYEIVAPLGAGGMGEVYEARDTRLGRTVAVKVLPDALADHPERRARFDREARTVSQLSHPHVCTLHDVGEEEGVLFLVLEHLEGETLARRIERGPLSVAETLLHGAQIGEALAAAHRRGVVHRDLKPANVMVTPTGVKLLDFGLARVASGGDEGLANLATITMDGADPLTADGAVLGTFPYMSPEQVEGEEADARSDIFALGALLYEMITGRRAFTGKSAASVMAAVLKEEPAPISTVEPVSPPALEHVVSRCLAKDREERWQSAKDVALELRWIADRPPEEVDEARLRRPPFGLAGLLFAALAAVALVGAGFALAWFQGERGERPLAAARVVLEVPPPKDGEFYHEVNQRSLALSPDGTTLAAVIWQRGASILALRRLDDPELRPLAGTEGATAPFWSPDGAMLGFFADGYLLKIPAAGGPTQTVCAVSGMANGAWGPDGTIVFTQAMTEDGGLFRVPASGGTPSSVIASEHELAGGYPRFPRLLPDGRGVLFHRAVRSLNDNAICYADLETGEARVLFPTPSRVEYDPGSGRLLYVTDGTLVARAFDLETLTLSGEAVPIAEDLRTFITGWTPFAVSPAGVVAHHGGHRLRDLVWRDRLGREIGAAELPGFYQDVALSPDERRAVVEADLPARGESDLWLLDLERGTRQRLTELPGSESAAAWSPSGDEILFINHGSRESELHGIYRLDVESGERHSVQLGWEDTWNWPADWSSASELLVMRLSSMEGGELWSAPLAEGGPAPQSIGPVPLGFVRASPDGQWVAYKDSRSEPVEIVVSRIDGGERVVVSAGGGTSPHWRGDGRELYYISLDQTVTATALDVEGGITLGATEELFRLPPTLLGSYDVTWEVSADGQRFLFVEEQGDPIPVTVTLGWREVLGQE